MYNEEIMVLFDRVDELSDRIEALILKAELWQKLFDESPDGIALFNSKMRFFMVNKEFCAITSFVPEDLTNRHISMVLPRNIRRPHRKWEKEYKANPQKKTNRHGLAPTIINKFGEEIPVGIDLSYFEYDGENYYTAFLRRR